MAERTLVQGGWVVGFDPSRGGHELLRDGVVVYEGDRVLYVGHHFDGTADHVIDARHALVTPGFINTHLHLGSNATHVFFLDHTRADYFGSNFFAYSVGKRGTGDPRRTDRTDVQQLYGLWSAIRGGATTVLDIGTRNAEQVVDLVGQIGARAYLGPAFRSYMYVYDEHGRIQWAPDPNSGSAALARAVAFAKQYDGAHAGRVRCLLYPAQLDTCSVELLQEARRAADETGLRLSTHAAMNLPEVHRILREHGKTPIELLDSIGFLGPDVLLGHCVFHNAHSWAHYPYTNDLQRLADHGVSVAHAPYKYAKMGIALESFDRYRRLGINVALGTDTYPEDLIMEMRTAMMMARFAEGSFRAAEPHALFDAATLGGARALGRDDLGRLTPGAQADLLIVDLRGTHFGAVRDPIKSLIECASGRDIDTVVVAGRTLVEGGKSLVVDEAKLLDQIQASAEQLWDEVPSWHWNGATADQIAPMSYPVRAPEPATV